jgi:hypothetical protein
MSKRSKMINKAKHDRQIKKTKAKCANAASIAVFVAKRVNASPVFTPAPPVTYLPPSNVLAAISELSRGEKLSPLTTHLGLLPLNLESNTPNKNNEIDVDNDNNKSSVVTFNTAMLPVEKIERIWTRHGGDVGDGGTSSVDDDGFDVVQDFEIPMNDNTDKKLLN